ncbi:serine/threonine-protein kinase [Actinomadura sp. K4S16]|uniref:serine/threonine-protein kinase n=1 Tax=Actinomadura sp. K4S16 TaxID=1316147 RepID=UPI0011EE4853|nr:serine/threonine-protein kinase [Actinomadura sp. K4S16]
MTTAPEAAPGRLVGGRYRLVETLGRGGFGLVWKAHDTALGLDVAVKEMRPPAAELAERVARATREAHNAARLREHPNIVSVHDVVVEDGLPWIVMQLVDGHSLHDRIARSGPLPASGAARVAAGLLNALETAHGAGIVHRDVKPANVLLTGAGDAVLTDFGIAVHHADTTLTATGAFIGSLEYMAPERIDGNDEPASDLFSLGATLYQAVEGVSPFRRDTTSATLKAVITDPPAPPRRAGGLTELITRLLAKDPAERPTISEARALLARASEPEDRRPRDADLTGCATVTEISRPPVESNDGRTRIVDGASWWSRASIVQRTVAAALVAAALLGLAMFLGRQVYGQPAAEAGIGDCVYHAGDSDFGFGTKQGDWYRTPCHLRLANGTAYETVGQTADDPDDPDPQDPTHGCKYYQGWNDSSMVKTFLGVDPRGLAKNLCLSPIG